MLCSADERLSFLALSEISYQCCATWRGTEKAQRCTLTERELELVFMDLVTNAIEAIRAGVEDYREGSHSRLLSAVRNIHSGILLLYKEALRRKSPQGTGDVLVMAKILPSCNASGKVIFVGVGKKTADAQQIRERFDALGIETDWKRFERINRVRNEVEHLYPCLDQKGLEGLIADSFLLVRNFVSRELQEDPLELLEEPTWRAMLTVAEVYQKEKEDCIESVNKAAWPTPLLREGVFDLSCPSCSGNLLRPVSNPSDEIWLKCVSCGEEQSPESYVPNALESALRGDAYIAMTDGGDPPLVHCPECMEKAFLTEDWRCVLCGAEPERRCACCSNPIPVEELDSLPYCGYCQHIMNKDD